MKSGYLTNYKKNLLQYKRNILTMQMEVVDTEIL